MAEQRPSRRIHFTDRTLKALKPPPRPKQVDYFDESLPGFGCAFPIMGASTRSGFTAAMA
jgi:hypothetical protein